MGKLAISLLGSMQVTLDSAPVYAFESGKVRALLAYLMVESQQSHRREALAELLWPEYPEGRARHNLSQALYDLRNTLQERLPREQPLFLLAPETIQLNPASDHWLDVNEFNLLIEACERHPHHVLETCLSCQERIQQAAAIYRGEFLEGFSAHDSTAYEEWLLVNRERCRGKARWALASLAASHERYERIDEALQITRRLVALDPYDDDACQMLLRLLAVSGKRGDALAHYDSFRSVLRAELNLAPQAETTAFYKRILLQKEGQPVAAPRRHNLPASLSPLIGREVELAKLQRRLLDPTCRLLTVLGPGGVGKSRLALETGRGLLDRFADGVYLVSLSPLTSLEAILPALATALEFKIMPQKTPLAQVQDYLRQKEILLVLDGCEGLLEGVPLILDLLRSAPDLKILATSRERLKAEEEQVYLLDGLAYPNPGQPDAANYPAVRLFASGARRVRSAFALDPHDLPAVVEICSEVQGMPLAILLATAWMEVFTPAEILAEMHHSPDFLQAEWADLPARQRSVRATFDYSWNLLDENEQGIFQALCVFRGRFIRQAAEVISGTDPRELRRLVDKSLVTPLAGEWYTIHTLLQQFGLEKLNAQPAVHREVHQRYSAYFLERVIEWEAGIKGALQLETLTALDTKINDLRSAWDWTAENCDIDRLESGVEGLCLYYELRARFIEGKSLCQETAIKLAERREPEAQRLLARLAAWESRYCRLLGKRDLARQRLEASQALVDDLAASGLEALDAQALIHLEAGEAVFMADLAEAQRCLEHSLELYRQIGDTWRIAGVLTQLGINRFHASDYPEADRLFAAALGLYQELGASIAVANIQGRMAHNQSRLGKIESGLALLRQVAAFSQASGDRAQAMLDLRTLGLALMWNGLWEDAPLVFQQALSIAQDLGNRYEMSFIYLCLGLATNFLGQYELAHQYHARALELARRDGYQREVACSLFSLGCIAIVEKTPQEARRLFHESITLYRQVGDPDELGWALSLDALCCLAEGDTEQARQLLVEALGTAHSKHAYFTAVLVLPVCAWWLRDRGEMEKALEIYTCVFQQPLLANSKWFHDIYDKNIAACAEGLPPEIAASAQERGRQRQLWSAVAELLHMTNITIFVGLCSC